MIKNNEFTLQGTLPRAPKVFKGKKVNVARFTVEIPRPDSTSRDYIDMVAFGEQADNIARWGKPGTELALTSTLQSSRFEKNGKMVYTQDVVATHVATLDGAKTVAEQAADADDAPEADAEAKAEAPAPKKRSRAKKS